MSTVYKIDMHIKFWGRHGRDSMVVVNPATIRRS